MSRLDLNTRAQSLFSFNVKNALRSFVEYIDEKNPDIIVLIARKGICLFELFPFLGIPRPKAEIVSDRILDLEIEYYRDKKVMVVDDTLIIGSTLSEIRKKLEKHNIDFSIAVFIADRDNWDRTRFKPDHIELLLPSEAVMGFCIAEVNAFAAVSMPYLLDFPISTQISTPRERLNSILSAPDVKHYELPSGYEKLERYSLFLEGRIRELFFKKMGPALLPLVEVLKVRIFGHDGISDRIKIKFVPIVLLKPLSSESIDQLFDFVVPPGSRHPIFDHLKQPIVRLRFIQYYFSYILGNIFIDYVNDHCNGLMGASFRSTETINLFGKSITEEFIKLIRTSNRQLVNEVQYEEDVELGEQFQSIFKDIHIDGYSVLEGFQQIFANMFAQIEIPAREATRNGDGEAANAKRLKSGISFSTISKFLFNSLDIEPSKECLNIFSLGLDVCNDLGVSVPVISSNSNKVFYRAYRYGELGLRTEGNKFLFSEFLKSFLFSNNYDTRNGIDNVLLEKLAAFFFRVGAKKGFIESTYDYSDPKAINFGFYLFGVVPILNPERKGEPIQYFQKNPEQWFINAICGEGMLLYNRKKRKYAFKPMEKPGKGLPPTIENSPSNAIQLGATLGKVISVRKSKSDGDHAPLNIKKFTILTSCYSEIDLLMALAAELSIVKDWSDKIGHKQAKDLLDSVYLEQFKTSNVFKAFNQGYFKLTHSLSDVKNPQTIINEVANYFSTRKDLQSHTTWTEAAENLNIGQTEIIDSKKLSDDIVRLITNIAASLFMLGNYLHYIRHLRVCLQNVKKERIHVGTVVTYYDHMLDQEQRRTMIEKSEYDIDESLEINYESGFAKVLRKSALNVEITFKQKRKFRKITITNIDNKNAVYDSFSTFIRFNNNVVDANAAIPIIQKYGGILPDDNYKEIRDRMIRVKNAKKVSTLIDELDWCMKEIRDETRRSSPFIDESRKFREKSNKNFVSYMA